MEKRRVILAKFHAAIQLHGYINVSGGVLTSINEKITPEAFATDIGVYIPLSNGNECFVGYPNVQYMIIEGQKQKAKASKAE